jgi:hypothetical protein
MRDENEVEFTPFGGMFKGRGEHIQSQRGSVPHFTSTPSYEGKGKCSMAMIPT